MRYYTGPLLGNTSNLKKLDSIIDPQIEYHNFNTKAQEEGGDSPKE